MFNCLKFKPSKRKLIKEIKKSVKDLRNYSSEIFSEKIKELEESGQLSNNIISAILKNASKYNMKSLIFLILDAYYF